MSARELELTEQLSRALADAAKEKRRADSLFSQLEASHAAVRQLNERAETKEAYTSLAAQVWDLEKSASVARTEASEATRSHNTLARQVIDLAALLPLGDRACAMVSPLAVVDQIRKRLVEFRSMERGRAKEAAALRRELKTKAVAATNWPAAFWQWLCGWYEDPGVHMLAEWRAGYKKAFRAGWRAAIRAVTK